jgi:deoxycytidylate deaminase
MFALSLIQKYAKKSVHKQHRHVAILTRGGAIAAIGYNRVETHAEEKAISKIWPNKRRGLVLWSFRITKAGKLAMAKPCPHCEALLMASGISTVHYSDSSGSIQMMRLAS